MTASPIGSGGNSVEKEKERPPTEEEEEEAESWLAVPFPCPPPLLRLGLMVRQSGQWPTPCDRTNTVNSHPPAALMCVCLCVQEYHEFAYVHTQMLNSATGMAFVFKRKGIKNRRLGRGVWVCACFFACASATSVFVCVCGGISVSHCCLPR